MVDCLEIEIHFLRVINFSNWHSSSSKIKMLIPLFKCGFWCNSSSYIKTLLPFLLPSEDKLILVLTLFLWYELFVPLKRKRGFWTFHETESLLHGISLVHFIFNTIWIVFFVAFVESYLGFTETNTVENRTE